MLFKALVIGHVLFASAYENKALHELQADVDTLEKTLKGGAMEKERMVPAPILPTVYATTSLTIPANHQCGGGTACTACRRGTYPTDANGNPTTPPLSFTRATVLDFQYDDTPQACNCNAGMDFRVKAAVAVSTCRHWFNPGGAHTDWPAAHAANEPTGYRSGTGYTVWHGCTDAAATYSDVIVQAPAPLDADGFTQVGADGKPLMQEVSVTPTYTLQGTALTHVCG